MTTETPWQIGIPMPARVARKTNPHVQKMVDMPIGASFFIPGETDDLRFPARVHCWMKSAEQRKSFAGAKMSRRAVTENGLSGYRVFKLAKEPKPTRDEQLAAVFVTCEACAGTGDGLGEGGLCLCDVCGGSGSRR